MFQRRRGGGHGEEGFTLIEILVATTVLVIVMSAMGPVFYGAMRLTGITGQRSQATHIAVSAIEQMRSLPYSEVGYHATPAACSGSGSTPVTLVSAGPLDSLPTTELEGRTSFTVQRCVYWSASSLPGKSEAYKQTVVKVSWQAPGGAITVSQSSALYPGGYSPGSPPPTPVHGLDLAPTCTAGWDATNPTTMVDLTLTPAVGTNPHKYLLYYTTDAPTGAITSESDYTTVAVATTAPKVTVGPGATYYFQAAAVWDDGTTSPPSRTCTVAPSPTYTSTSSATLLSMALGGSTVAYTVTSPGTSASNDGTGSNAPNTVQPTIAMPGADSFLSVTGGTQSAEANTDGSSYACAGLLSTGQTLGSGSGTGPCPVTGSGSGGVSLNLSALPGVGSAVNSLVGGLVLKFNSASAWAAATAGGSGLTGSASLGGGTITVTPLSGLLPAQTIPLSLPGTVSSSTDCVKAITTAISGNAVVGSLAATLQTALSSVLTLTCGYQSTAGGKLTESALHIGVLSGAGQADLAVSTVGPNTTQTTSHSGSCSINSLVVSPPGVPADPYVVLTAAGTLAQGDHLELSVNVNGACSNVKVAYSLNGCAPGDAGCTPTYVTTTGTAGTYYGSAGTASTVWPTGTTTFTVFTGSTPTIYSPLTTQQVTMCTEKGSSGQC